MKISIIILIFCVLASCKPKIKTDPNVYYTCSMHLQIHEKKMGKCPICFMDLTKMLESSEHKKQIHLSESQIKLANIKVDTAHIGEIGDEVQLHAKLVVNENNVQNISSRFAGRVEQLFFKNAGDHIDQGAPLFEIYSEEVLSVEKTYIMALEHLTMKTNQSDYERIVESTKNKLLLWGLTEKQIAKLKTMKDVGSSITIYSQVSGCIQDINIKQGDYIMEGKQLFRVADLSSLWIEAQAFSSEMQQIDDKREVKYQVSSFPNEWKKGKVSFVSPELQADSKVNLVRVEIENPEQKYKPGMLAFINFTTHPQKGIVLPINSVLQSQDGNRVWIQVGNGDFEPRTVGLGIQNSSDIEIVSGISANDLVVVSGAYLLHSEMVLKDSE